ncbi:MAG: hypothetical protein ACI8XB_003038 [Patiriisocius sp.]
MDVRSSGYQTEIFTGSDLTELWVDLIDSDQLDGINVDRPGVGYDLVIDRNQNGMLDLRILLMVILRPECMSFQICLKLDHME